MRRDEVIRKRGYSSLIAGDDLSLEIASYPVTARYLAERLREAGVRSVCELCCGVGVSLIEFAPYFDDVTGVERDERIAELARKNCESSGVRCDIRLGDVADEDVLKGIAADAVAYDIPYWKEYGQGTDSRNPDLARIVALIRRTVSQDIVVYAPPHMTHDTIRSLLGECEYQEVWIDGRYDRNFVYLGRLARTLGATKVELQNK